MDSVVEYSRSRAIAKSLVGSGSGGGGVDDILKRLGNVETHVTELRSEVSALSATVSHLATSASVTRVESRVDGILAIIPHLATKADLKGEIAMVNTAIGELKAGQAHLEAAIIKWVIATGLTTAALAFTIAKFVH